MHEFDNARYGMYIDTDILSSSEYCLRSMYPSNNDNGIKKLIKPWYARLLFIVGRKLYSTGLKLGTKYIKRNLNKIYGKRMKEKRDDA